jgi:hypothetical protein
VTGELAVLDARGKLTKHSLGHAVLFTPLIDEGRSQVVISAADGRTLGLPLGAL